MKEPPALGGTLWKLKSTFPRASGGPRCRNPPSSSNGWTSISSTLARWMCSSRQPRTKQRIIRNLRTAAVVETDDLMRVGQERFLETMQSNSHIMQSVVQMLLSRLRLMDEHLADKATVVPPGHDQPRLSARSATIYAFPEARHRCSRIPRHALNFELSQLEIRR